MRRSGRWVVIAVVVGLAALGGITMARRAVGVALADAPAAEPLPFTQVELRGGIDQALRGQKVLASLAPVEPFEMVDDVMRIQVDLPLAGLRQALSSPELVTSRGERFVIDDEEVRTATLMVHLERR